MSDIPVERRIKTQRVRSLGDATPIYRAGETAAKTAGEKTHGEIDKTMTERFAEMRDAAEITTRCAIDDCPWVHVGPAGEARQIALAHRQDAHKHIEKGVRRCTTPGCTGRAVRNLPVCGRCHKTGRREKAVVSSMRARGLNRDGTRLLEEVASADGDVGAASSSSRIRWTPDLRARILADTRPLAVIAAEIGTTAKNISVQRCYARKQAAA